MKTLSLFFIFTLFLVTPSPTLAYIDPGTGSIIIQAIVAAFAGVLLYVKLYWHKLKSLFTKKNDREKPAPTLSSDDAK